MNALLTLTKANIRSFVRDRAALFWTLAFPLIFIVLFGSIFSSAGDLNYRIGWVDEDGTSQSQLLHDVFGKIPAFTLSSGSLDDELASMRKGDLRGIVVVPKGYGVSVPALAATDGAASPAAVPTAITLYTDPSQQTTSQVIQQIVGQVVGGINQAASGRPPVLTLRMQALQSEQLRYIDYFVPSILAMALMQLGIFSAIPLVQQREKAILKRLSATPLRRWTLVGSNVAMRLLIAIGQAVLIVGVGRALFGVQIIGNLLPIAGLVILGSMTFISIGYVIASFAPTEETANALTSIVQFPLMFLSGIFFPLDQMPDWLRSVATAMPLTYLGDALRQTMVGGIPFAPVLVSVAVLTGWLVVCFGISSRFFRWE
ncbi:MAG TPA: ABC transporter permease [Candidatus Limnocylindrales bacterium]